ncbi:serine hydroxymethyltransferase [Arthrobacter sp. H14]|uniref:serine hydroxymethyltransferase n=1 Tax=Arthrobacter sp. H14 TaxID=1312959 RepID=UPI00047B0D30|nr:DegT/DnrJ/EryC1/StrS family aminotransferase [Arthrobacter sp. H14]
MFPALSPRSWVPAPSEDLVRRVSEATAADSPAGILGELDRLVEQNRTIHDVDAVNLNPATNAMNPRAEAMLSAQLGRPSLGYPGDKYEMGLEAIERIEIIAAELAAEVFSARHAEVRVGSGALANLYAFMATCKPGDTIIAPPADIGGHVTHHAPGAAGMYGINTVPALRTLAHEVRPKLITVGGSLNLFPHPISAIRGIADEVGAYVLFDAAHLCGMIAGKAWPQPLAEGAHLMTMSTYKSLGGPPSGLAVTDDDELAQRLDVIAFPGLTANFDAGKTAALAVTMVDWKVAGADYARAMIDTAQALAAELADRSVEIFAAGRGGTTSHQFGIPAASYGGGQQVAHRLRKANLLACGIGLPAPLVEGDMNGLRIGTPEIVRRGMRPADMPELAGFIARGLDPGTDPEQVAPEVSAWRKQFDSIHFTADNPN